MKRSLLSFFLLFALLSVASAQTANNKVKQKAKVHPISPSAEYIAYKNAVLAAEINKAKNTELDKKKEKSTSDAPVSALKQ